MLRRPVAIIGLLLAGFLLVGAARPVKDPPPEAALRQLYEDKLENPDDASIDTRIQEQRVRVRESARASFEQLAATIGKTASGAVLTADSTYERQRAIVTTLEAREQELKVDIDLLTDEERSFIGETGTGNIIRAHESYPALLAHKTVLEEELAALGEVIAQQKARMQRLSIQERLSQASDIALFAGYAVTLLAVVFLERLLRRWIFGRIKNRNRRYRAMKYFSGIVYTIVGIIIVLRLSAEFPGLLTSFAIVGAGVAIALQDVIKDLFGWVLIMQRRLFTLGQRVSIGAHTGDVIDIGPFRTTLLEVFNSANTDPGRVGQTLYVPNSMVLREPVLNYHNVSDFMEAEVRVKVPHAANWRRTEEILREILEEHTRRFVDHALRQTASRTQHFYTSYEPKGPRVLLDLDPKGIWFTLRFPVPIGERKQITSKISRDILERFSKESPVIEMGEEV